MVPCIQTILICLLLLRIRASSDDSYRLLAELELADLELADSCSELSNGMKTALFKKSYREKMISEESLGHLLRMQSNRFKKYEDIPTEVNRNWTFLVKPGDGLLPEEDYKTLVSYHNANEELISVIKIPCLNNTDGCVFTKEEYQSLLKNTKDADILNGTWSAWQNMFITNKDQYSSILDFVKKSAELNGKENARSYWEFLTEIDEGYYKASEFWKQIQPLYMKLHTYVKTKLFNYYHLKTSSSDIPVFLLGSNFGMDWSFIADIILPHPQLHYDAESFLKHKNMKEIYLLAENLANTIQLGKLGQRLWSNSKFNLTYCEPQIITYCSEEYSELYDCDQPSWITYLDAHETAFRVSLKNQDYLSLMRENLRYSPIDEAVATLGSILSIESLAQHGVIKKDSEDESIKMTKLLLIALRVLPRLPYYLAADEWRLAELENPSGNVAASWWNFRKKYQGVTGITNIENDFLRDKYITFNKPYLSKFFGDILAFQLLNYYQNLLTDSTSDVIQEFGKDLNFLSMIKEKQTTDWSYLLTLNYGFDLSAQPLLDYLKPLEQYLEKAPLKQHPIITTTTTTSTTTTIAPTTVSTSHNSNASEKGLNEKIPLKIDAVLNDQPKTNITQKALEKDKNSTGQITMYAGVGILVLVVCLLVGAYGYKHIRRRRRPNNRRFAT